MRGFTATPERQREIASLGGKAIRPEDRSFSTDRALAMKAGRKGGLARAKNAALKAKD
jgi:general stress protein YciG